MSETDSHIDELLRRAFALETSISEAEADKGAPLQVPAELRARILKRAAQLSSELLATRLREAGKKIGWSVDDLAEEATGQANDARRFLRDGGDPSCFLPHAFARLFWRTEMPLDEWRELLLQTVAAYTVFREPLHGEVWGRTTGLTGPVRGDALLGAKEGKRDPAQAERVARGFVEEVIEEWTRLKNKRTTRKQMRSPEDE